MMLFRSNWKLVAMLVLLVITYKVIFKREGPVMIPGDGGVIALKEGEKEVVGIVGRKITTVRGTYGGDTEVKTRYIPADGGARVTIHNDGTVNVKVRNKGLAMSPGLGVYYADTLRPSLDLNVAYWNRLGVNVGLGFGKHPGAVPFIAVNYAWGNVRFQNTSIMAGYDARRYWLVGARVRF